MHSSSKTTTSTRICGGNVRALDVSSAIKQLTLMHEVSIQLLCTVSPNRLFYFILLYVELLLIISYVIFTANLLFIQAKSFHSGAIL